MKLPIIWFLAVVPLLLGGCIEERRVVHERGGYHGRDRYYDRHDRYHDSGYTRTRSTTNVIVVQPNDRRGHYR